MKKRALSLCILTCAVAAHGAPKRSPPKPATAAAEAAPVAAPEPAPPNPTPQPAPITAPTPTPTPTPALVASAAPAPSVNAAPAPAAVEKPRLVVLDLSPAGGLDPTLAGAMSEVLTADVSKIGVFAVTSQKDLVTSLGLERQRQLLGCSEESCLTELADALGARFVMSGTLAKLGDAYQLNVQTVDSRTNKALGRATRIAPDMKALRGAMPYVVAEATGTPPPTPPSRVLPITLLAVGGVSLVASGIVFVQSLFREETALNELKLGKEQPSFTLRSAQYYREEAARVVELRVIGAITAGVGTALAVLGVVLMPPAEARLSVVPLANGLGLVGVWP